MFLFCVTNLVTAPNTTMNTFENDYFFFLCNLWKVKQQDFLYVNLAKEDEVIAQALNPNNQFTCK